MENISRYHQYQYLSAKNSKAPFERTLLSTLFCLYLLCGLIGYIELTNQGRAGLAYFVATMIGSSFLFVEFCFLKQEYKLVYGLIGVLLLGILISSIINGRSYVSLMATDLPQILSGSGVALFLLRRPLSSFVLRFTYLVFAVISAYFAYYFYNNVSPNEIFVYSSQNTVSWLFIIYSAIVYIISSKLNSSTPLLPPVITLIFSVMSYGRSGIIASIILFIGILLLIFCENPKKSKYYLYLFITFFIASLMFSYGNYRVETIIYGIYGNGSYFEKFENQGLSDSKGREIIWSKYISQINPTRFFFGTNDKTDSAVTMFNRNYHNSFLELHAKTGIAGIIYILFALLAMFKLFSSEEMLLLLILICLVSRSSTDSGLFFNHYSFAIHYIVFYAFSPKAISRVTSSK